MTNKGDVSLQLVLVILSLLFLIVVFLVLFFMREVIINLFSSIFGRFFG
ncbi:hypothetical protein KY334_03750 [Candidatus Woesearchaeota archaeon]|nr:hypothetical protein [Candidatus Woesearchaeota archaeon]